MEIRFFGGSKVISRLLEGSKVASIIKIPIRIICSVFPCSTAKEYYDITKKIYHYLYYIMIVVANFD